ncbi:MAG TPA: transglutaminase family protein [Polyangiales bacterium]|nr:transglutaminase family protein [Polyangiales bacterium]
MRFVVRHQTVYRYSVPVQLATHILRLTPRPGSVRTIEHAIELDPLPSARRARIDELGNLVSEVDFLGSTSTLRIDSRVDVETFPAPALLQPMAALPIAPAPFDPCANFRIAPIEASVSQFAHALASRVGHDLLAFLDELSRTLFERTDQAWRQLGAAHAAAETLATGRGACRDLTVLYIAACRSLGIASRFTSGYVAPLDQLDSQRQLHAWAEVFLPDVGWRGWDPSQGARVSDRHLPLCAAADQAETMPVEGGFYFNGAIVDTTLDYDLRVSVS